MIVVLEGGYNIETISRATELVTRTLVGEEMPVKNSYTTKTFEEF